MLGKRWIGKLPDHFDLLLTLGAAVLVQRHDRCLLFLRQRNRALHQLIGGRLLVCGVVRHRIGKVIVRRTVSDCHIRLGLQDIGGDVIAGVQFRNGVEVLKKDRQKIAA